MAERKSTIRDPHRGAAESDMTDELNEPLGLGDPAKGASRPRFARSAFGVLALLCGGLAAWAFLPRDPHGGEPYAAARIEIVEPPAADAPNVAEAVRPPGEAAAGAAAARDDAAGVADIERRSGVKITRPDNSDPPGALIIQLDASAGIRLPPAPDRRLVEKGRHGPLPRIGADGAKPMEVYARPVALSPKLTAGAPRLAIVVGGMGLSPQLSAGAIEELPDAVSLAFAPYGANVEALAARARAHGHEILLQAPMEPYDYPRNDPGPHTLLTEAQHAGALDDLHWLMSRFVGYVGVVNFLGARFTADEGALTPALADIAARGLFFLDDGTSPQSLVASVAPRVALPAARADLVIDAKAAPESIDAALARLEALARQNGAAIGFASALPAAVARIARFARDLERRGLALVPVSALAGGQTVSEPRAGRRK